MALKARMNEWQDYMTYHCGTVSHWIQCVKEMTDDCYDMAAIDHDGWCDAWEEIYRLAYKSKQYDADGAWIYHN